MNCEGKTEGLKVKVNLWTLSLACGERWADEDEMEFISPDVSAERLSDIDTGRDKPQHLLAQANRSSLRRSVVIGNTVQL